jgi:hypothetical protein
MWALIMTVYLGIPSYSESAATLTMSTISDFNSEVLCRYAGAQQEVILRNDFKINTAKKYSFICVKTKD